MQIYYFEENRRLFLAFIFSVLLHLSLLISLELRPDFSWQRHREERARPGDIIRFDLIGPEPPLVMETPEADKEEVPARPTNIVSDKNIAARDMMKKDENITDSPYAEGKSKLKDLRKSIPSAASMPQEEVSPQPEVRESLEGKAGIEMLTSKEASPEEAAPQKEALPQKEQVASIPRDVLSIPLYDDRLSNVRGFGEVTFNARKHDAAPYIIKMKKKIEEHWAPPVLFIYYGLTSGETVIRFKITPDGKVNDVKVIRETGDESLKKSSIQAILDASPFDPIPPQLLAGEKERYLDITFTFYYVIDMPEESLRENI